MEKTVEMLGFVKNAMILFGYAMETIILSQIMERFCMYPLSATTNSTSFPAQSRETEGMNCSSILRPFQLRITTETFINTLFYTTFLFFFSASSRSISSWLYFHLRWVQNHIG